MPYIDQEDRPEVRPVTRRPAESAGELNYQMTELALAYLAHHGLDYQACNDIVGAFDNAKDEFRRRVQHPYEERKRTINGDVYEGRSQDA